MSKSSKHTIARMKVRILKLLMMISQFLATVAVNLVHRIVIDAVCFLDIAMVATVDLHYSTRLV